MMRNARKGSLCNLHCTRKGSLCNLHCTRKGSLCNLHCTRKGSLWNLHCTWKGSSCNLHCTRKGSLCNLHCTRKGSLCNLHCTLTESTDSVLYVDEQRMSRSDCKDVHVLLDLHCSYMCASYGFFRSYYILSTMPHRRRLPSLAPVSSD